MNQKIATYIIVLFLYATSSNLLAQLPNTNIMLFDMKVNEVKMILDNPRVITGFNLTGYNNQPFFINDQSLLITSDYQAEGLTDIYQLNVNSQSILRISATEESEYSPTYLPASDEISMIRQEITDSDEVPQILWKYPISREHSGELLIDTYKNIGYHTWIDENKVALFLVGEGVSPHKLIIYDTQSQSEQFVAYNIGRCFKYDNNGGLIYLQKIGSSWSFRRFSIDGNVSKLVARALPDSEDFDLLENGDLISGQDNKLFRYKVGEASSDWEEILDLSKKGVKQITRIAHHKDKIAFVYSS